MVFPLDRGGYRIGKCEMIKISSNTRIQIGLDIIKSFWLTIKLITASFYVNFICGCGLNWGNFGANNICLEKKKQQRESNGAVEARHDSKSQFIRFILHNGEMDRCNTFSNESKWVCYRLASPSHQIFKWERS